MKTFRTPARRGQRGVSLIEALIAFAVMALGMLGVMGMQTTLRFNSDIAKQRSEATRLAQEQMEFLRAFSVLTLSPFHAADTRAYDAIVSAGPDPVQGYTMTNTTYTMTTTVQPLGDRKDVTVTVAWRDRQDGPQSVVLNSVIAGIDPALSGLLAIPPNGSPQKNPHGRHAGIPIEATFHGDGRRSLFSPRGESGNVHWVFDNATGVVTSLCTVRSGNQVSDCTAVSGLLISGVVRFDTDGQVSAAEAENPEGSLALDLDMALSLQGGHVDCFDNAPTAPTNATAVRYHCLVRPVGDNVRWSGTLDVVLGGGRTLGPAADQFRVCRYSDNYNGRDGIENLEHPRAYTDVTGPLTNQNFLVIRGDNSCPRDVAANPAQGDFLNSNTFEQAPNPAS